MLTQIEGNDWEVLLKPAKRIKVGNRLSFGDGKIVAECIKELEQGGRIMRLHYDGIYKNALMSLVRCLYLHTLKNVLMIQIGIKLYTLKKVVLQLNCRVTFYG